MAKKKMNKKVFCAIIEARKYSEIRLIFEEYNIVDLANLVENLELDSILLLFKILMVLGPNPLTSFNSITSP